jgi:uncharacterized protein (DUF433 family)
MSDNDYLKPATSRDPELHSGDLVFSGTRVPVATFVAHLKDGGSLDDFLEGFPTVERWQAESLLDQLTERPATERTT